MIKHKTVIEIKIGERIYELFVSPDSPLGEMYDAISQMQHTVISKINEVNESKKSSSNQEDVKIEEIQKE